MSVELFISHCSADAAGLVAPLSDLLRIALYGSDTDAFRRHVFFTGDTDQGLRSGETFDAMLTQLAASRAVLAVVTRHTAGSVAMVAEMSLARSQGKLVPAVGHPSYRRLLTWPLDQTQARALGSAPAVAALLQDLAVMLRRPLTTGPEVQAGIEKVARAFWWRCWPRPPDVRPLAVAAVAAAVGIGGVAAGRYLLPPETRHLALGSPVRLGDHEVKLLFNGTLPRALLSSRLVEMQRFMGEGVRAVPPEQVHAAFIQALQVSTAWPGLTPEQRERLVRIVRSWTSGDSQISKRGDLRCQDLKTDPDRAWCAAVQEVVSDQHRDAFDRDRFALVSVGSELRALMPGRRLAELPGWAVDDVGAVVLVRRAGGWW